MTPFISVVIITYNTGHLVERAIASVQAQTFRDFELIVVDDGSTDDTARRLAGRTDLCYLNVANGGSGSARNHGIAAARGTWVALLDSDDAWRPEKLELQVAVARDPRFAACGVIFSDYDEVREGRLVRSRAMRTGLPIFSECGLRLEDVLRRRESLAGTTVHYDLDFKALFHGNCILPSTALLKKECCERLGVFKSLYRTGAEDTDLFLRWGHGTDFACLDRPLVEYSVGRPGQQTSRARLARIVWNDLKLRKHFLRHHPEFLVENPALVNTVLAGVYARLGRLKLADGEVRGARVMFHKARRHGALSGRDALLRWAARLPPPLVRALLRLRGLFRPTRAEAESIGGTLNE